MRPGSASIGIVMATLLALCPAVAQGQVRERPPLGVAFNALLSSTEGLGIGLRIRASSPINSDLSLAFGGGISGFILQGRDDASYVFDPQVSMIITIPRARNAGTYMLGGFGAYLPFGNGSNGEAGPLIHFGVGWVQQLSETTVFYEVDPGLVVGSTSVSISLPVRVGVIF
jgi:hypothetical protein